MSAGRYASEKVNDKKVVPLPSSAKQSGGATRQLVKGADLFPEPFANIGVVGRKKSGKTLTIRHIIRDCSTPATVVYAFSASVNKDKEWLNIAADCKKRGTRFVPYVSLGIVGKESHLTEILRDMKTELVPPEPSSSSSSSSESDCSDGEGFVSAAVTKKKKKKRVRKPKLPKYVELERIFIFDDLSEELNHPDVQSLLKTNRHWKSKVIVSTQYVGGKNGATTDGTRQFDYWLLFPNLNKQNLDVIINRAGIALEPESFYALYHQATEKPHNFLWIDVPQVEFRHNFNMRLKVPELEHGASTAAAPKKKSS